MINKEFILNNKEKINRLVLINYKLRNKIYQRKKKISSKNLL